MSFLPSALSRSIKSPSRLLPGRSEEKRLDTTTPALLGDLERRLTIEEAPDVGTDREERCGPLDRIGACSFVERRFRASAQRRACLKEHLGGAIALVEKRDVERRLAG